jgi:hypothetical protein
MRGQGGAAGQTVAREIVPEEFGCRDDRRGRPREEIPLPAPIGGHYHRACSYRFNRGVSAGGTPLAAHVLA